jgi:hypothetical protein
MIATYCQCCSQLADPYHPDDGGDTSVPTRATRHNSTEDGILLYLYCSPHGIHDRRVCSNIIFIFSVNNWHNC